MKTEEEIRERIKVLAEIYNEINHELNNELFNIPYDEVIVRKKRGDREKIKEKINTLRFVLEEEREVTKDE